MLLYLLMRSLAPRAHAPLQLYAAGSLREALTEAATHFELAGGGQVALTFGPSGLLHSLIQQGEQAQVFASADMEHPDRLAQSGGWLPPVVFARNRMCALMAPSVRLKPQTLLQGLLDPALRLGTSTPTADPSGDYAWAVFRRAEAVKPGAYAALDAKALKLSGGPDSPLPPPGRSLYAWLMEEGKADVFLTYCAAALAARREAPQLEMIELSGELQVAASYGLTSRCDDARAAGLAQYLLSERAQSVLQRYGFARP